MIEQLKAEWNAGWIRPDEIFDRVWIQSKDTRAAFDAVIEVLGYDELERDPVYNDLRWLQSVGPVN